jgi:hypothetical protein
MTEKDKASLRNLSEKIRGTMSNFTRHVQKILEEDRGQIYPVEFDEGANGILNLYENFLKKLWIKRLHYTDDDFEYKLILTNDLIKDINSYLKQLLEGHIRRIDGIRDQYMAQLRELTREGNSKRYKKEALEDDMNQEYRRNLRFLKEKFDDFLKNLEIHFKIIEKYGHKDRLLKEDREKYRLEQFKDKLSKLPQHIQEEWKKEFNKDKERVYRYLGIDPGSDSDYDDDDQYARVVTNVDTLFDYGHKIRRRLKRLTKRKSTRNTKKSNRKAKKSNRTRKSIRKTKKSNKKKRSKN